VLNVLSNNGDGKSQKTLYQKLLYLEDKNTDVLPFYVQDNLPVFSSNIDHLQCLCEMTSIGDLLQTNETNTYTPLYDINPLLSIVAPMIMTNRIGNMKKTYTVPKIKYYKQK